MKNQLNILITAPSLDESQNVSGISSVVRQIVERGSFDYKHFSAGKKDGERQNARWILKQTVLPFEFFRVIKREKIEVVHINTAFNPLSIMRDFALVKAAKFAKVPILLHIHGGKFLAQEFNQNRLKIITEKMLRAADKILVLSKLEKEIIETRCQNLRVEVLENAVAVEDFTETEKRKNSIIFLGRLHESKGLNEIVETVRVLKSENFDFTFRAFGAGDLKIFFVAEMTKILGDNFYFGGVTSGKAKQSELTKSDIFILPSRYGEGLPMAMLEAMSASNIVIVSEMASIGAVIENNVNGFLVEPKNILQLTETLRNILLNKIDAENIRNNARKTVEEKYNLQNYIEKLETIYESLILRSESKL
jgi:glycosyltransferase involved in cell wall biosynthesis